MRILLQRVSEASVTVEQKVVASIQRGFLLFVCVMDGDTEEDLQWLMRKIASLRLFEGDDGKVNQRSIVDIGGEILVVSQFTLSGDIQKGARPDYTKAAKPDHARSLYEKSAGYLKQEGVQEVQMGMFGAHMHVSLVNDGPVTIWLER